MLIDLKIIKEEVEKDEHLKEVIARLQRGEKVKIYTLQHDMLWYQL